MAIQAANNLRKYEDGTRIGLVTTPVQLLHLGKSRKHGLTERALKYAEGKDKLEYLSASLH